MNEHMKIEILEKKVADLKKAQDASIAFLKECVPHLGMIAGENILHHIADITGGYFSSKEYTAERMPGEQ